MKLAIPALSFAALFLFAPACGTAPKTMDDRADLEARAATAVARAKRADPTMARQLETSLGYAVFPSIGKGAAGVGGAYGKGVLYEGGHTTGYCDMVQGTVGLQLGGQTYSEIIVFRTTDALQDFKAGQFTFDAQATAVALESGAAANAAFRNGVSVFTMDEAGLMFEASLGGQKFSYRAK